MMLMNAISKSNEKLNKLTIWSFQYFTLGFGNVLTGIIIANLINLFTNSSKNNIIWYAIATLLISFIFLNITIKLRKKINALIDINKTEDSLFFNSLKKTVSENRKLVNSFICISLFSFFSLLGGISLTIVGNNFLTQELKSEKEKVYSLTENINKELLFIKVDLNNIDMNIIYKDSLYSKNLDTLNYMIKKNISLTNKLIKMNKK